MTPAARFASAIEILDAWLGGSSLDGAYRHWSRNARYAGSSDRAAIRDLVFDAVRRRRSYSGLGGTDTGRGLMIGALRAAGVSVSDVFNGRGHAPAPLSQPELAIDRELTRAEWLDVPDWLLPRFEEALGDRAETVMRTLRDRAPIHLRVNTLNIDREDVIERLSEVSISAEPHPTVETAITVTEGARRLPQSEVIEEGLAELQDASSQAVIARLAGPSDSRILDYCAGAGGKSLALCDLFDAEVHAHDIDPDRMSDLPARAQRAGVDIGYRTTAELKDEAPYDLVLCDAPCSGSGTWRRDPEGKWMLTPDRLAGICGIQSEILEDVGANVRLGGRLAYVTCSVFKEENEDRAAAFLAAHERWSLIDEHRIDPSETGDGFYLAVFQRGPRTT
ncbi:RsmB/NOP family class I SAM-dependent RNA methyltransferase [Pelagovum pacificum]|uniref:RsmB/NOP family class I SAM-dependent RNA methyltransferase n=1 Tax=Pelagovum pacificum TaxID=2588711 RepID=A0A5C5GCB7_9RHOB|nr:RsmB/NOP family class I SAM-dependent RNA methyltransferase [Pelagovum pacificum]QQA44590.1 RsmB/NOP family class I SAM-dependent RNA methyltransferase [Pelagovum pacificum]TNY32298.1 RsmB/NOP family class I SAM-dependent RNA methyltransferase [Pelagovum pacificum]